MMIHVDQNKCICCGACVVICPVSAIRLQKGVVLVDLRRCTGCARCVCKCYARAITAGQQNR